MPKRKARGAPALPTRNEIIEYLNDTDHAAARRDIARAFGVKGEARAELRSLLKQMEADGVIDLKGGKRVQIAGRLPPVTPIDIIGVTHDGDLECEPAGWKDDHAPPMIRISEKSAAKTKPAPGVGDRVLARLKPDGDGAYTAEIIKAIGKGAHRFLAVFRKDRRGMGADPVERRARGSFTIERGDEAGAKDGDLVWVETKNARGYGPQRARVRKIEGHIDDRDAFSTIALANHGIPTEFPAPVMRAAENAKLPGPEKRVDLRKTGLLTIDPADAKDHDDAVFAEPDPDPDNPGGHRIIVAIADVSFFVGWNNVIDKEARQRGNSVYLPDRVVPMLPERLSNDLCSLREGVDRPCLAVEMIIDSGGNKKRHTFMRAVMRSAAKLSYEDAQGIHEGAGADPDIQQTISSLFAAFRARWTERQKRAPLDLDLPERKVLLNKKGEVSDVVKRERLDAHRVIEEFMILANVAAAETLERARLNLIYRVHDQPDEDDLQGVREYLDGLDYKLTKGGSVRPANFNQILKIAGERDEKEMISQIVLRAQRQAIYDTENRGHFGLNLPRYAHFTSPIRRYADLAVHRALVRAAKLGPGGQSKEEADALDDIAEQISDLERRAIAAEREASDRYLTEYLAGRVGLEFRARIRGVTKFGLFVGLDESGADGFIPMRSIGDERYRFEDAKHRIVGETTGGVYRLGQPVQVRLAEAIPLTGSLRFEMVSDPLAPDPKKAKTRKPKRGGGPKRSGKKASGKSRKKKSKSNAKPRRERA
ncbi:MAG: ribonuclease R [Pseudomonadota bacterium]